MKTEKVWDGDIQDYVDVWVGDKTVHSYPIYTQEVVSDSPTDGWTEGVKYDQDKLPYHLLPPELLEGVAAVLQFGAEKYSARNWEMGMGWSRPFGALMRHMWAWWRGDKADPETGMSHLWHAGCCIAFLIAYEERQIGEDDRPK